MSTTLTPWQGDEIARNLERQTGGRWAVWYGHFTGHFWAIPRTPYWGGHIEAASALELLARIGEVDAWFGPGGGQLIGAAQTVTTVTAGGLPAPTNERRPRPPRPSGHAEAVRAPRSGRAPLRRASGAWGLA